MLDKNRVKKVHADINAALAEVAKKHGLVLSAMSKCRFDATTFTYTGQFAEAEAAGGVDPKLIANANRYGGLYGLHVTGLYVKHPRLGAAKYVGMSGRSKAVIQAENGKMYTMPASQVLTMVVEKP